jgi:perosamine synthetase
VEVRLVRDAVQNGWGSSCYDYIEKFEKNWTSHLGVKFAIATSSCTGALHMGLAALGVGRGDEVILADSNWVASVAPVVHLGARPVFVDILPDTWCLDPFQVERAITRRTRAILAVHLYGNLCDMDRLLRLGRRHGIPVIEDAAEAIGSVWRGRKAGSMGRFGAFSFHGTKTLTTGEGGIFVTNDQKLHTKVMTLANHGRAPRENRQFWASYIGYKYKMSNLQAALGCGQLRRVQEMVARKREILAYYRRKLQGEEGIMMNPEHPGTRLGAWMPTVVFPPESGINRARLLEAFRKKNIDARVFFWPLSGLPMFRPVRTNRHAWSIPNRAINLPSYHDMTRKDQDRVIQVIQDLLREKRR